MSHLNAVTLLDNLRRQADLLKVEGKLPAVALDLDGKLFNNGPRTLQIISEFLSRKCRGYGRLFVEVRKELAQRQVPYSPQDCLELFLSECRTRKPLFGLEDRHRATFINYWKSVFFTHEYQRYDLVEPGAKEFAHVLLDAGIMVIYLTGRDAPNMRHGAVDALFMNGFPVLVPNTQIVLKPDFSMSDVAFKSAALTAFDKAQVEVLAMVDNEPGIVNAAIGCGVSGVHFVRPHAPNSPPLSYKARVLDSFVINIGDEPQIQ